MAKGHRPRGFDGFDFEYWLWVAYANGRLLHDGPKRNKNMVPEWTACGERNYPYWRKAVKQVYEMSRVGPNPSRSVEPKPREKSWGGAETGSVIESSGLHLSQRAPNGA